MRKLPVYIILVLISVVMLYPLLWLFGASFKTNDEIFGSMSLIPENLDITPYIKGWETVTPYTMGHYFVNTFRIVLPKTVFATASSVLVAYGFARFDFPLKRVIFALLMGTMLLPPIVTVMPTYLMWSYTAPDLLGTYIPLTLPSLFACEGMFVFILIQFFRTVPREFDEAARIDGCSTLKTLIFVLMPCIRPAIISIAVFTFLWTMNDFLDPLIFIQQVKDYPLSLALRLSVDSTGQGYEQNRIIAMSIIGLLPSIAVFAIAQRKFAGSITSGGLIG